MIRRVLEPTPALIPATPAEWLASAERFAQLASQPRQLRGGRLTHHYGYPRDLQRIALLCRTMGRVVR